MAKKIKYEFKCNKCGKPQQKDEKQSSNNFDVFPCNAKCECGGTFQCYMDGNMLGGGS